MSGQDEAGHPLYKAKVVLEPRVSRIEIGKFEYTAPTQGQRKYKSIEVQQVMLNNYFGKADRQGGTASDIQNSDINPGSIFGLFETAADAWYNDEFTSTESPATTLPLVTLDEIHSISIPTRKAMSVLHTTSFLKIIILEILTILKFL